MNAFKIIFELPLADMQFKLKTEKITKKTTYRLLLLTLIITMLSGSVFAQLTKIMGTVSDSATGEPMPFVNIVFKGTNTGITSDFDGNYAIETLHASDTLIASFVGYEKIKSAVVIGKFQIIDFKMKSSSVMLQDVVIRPGKNPAEILLDSIIAHKEQNDPDHFDAYQYEAYTKIELDANNITEKFQNRRMYRPFKFIFDNVDTSTVNGKTYLPIFLSETISDVYARKDPNGYIEKIKATKISGFNNQSAMQLLSDEYFNTNIYDNFIDLFQVNFVSPIAGNGLSFYKYYLVDSAYLEGRWCYKVMFKPRYKQTMTFTGNMWIHDSTYAVKEIEMRMAEDANMNFVNDLVIDKTFDIVDGEHWALTRDYTIGDFNLIENNKRTLGFFGKKTTTYRNYIIDEPKDPKFYTAPVDVIVSDSADKHDDTFWLENRHEDLTKDERTIYFMIDTLTTIPQFKTYIDIVEMVVTGYYVKGKFEIGPYASMLSFNAVEGARFRFGGRTSNKFSKKIMIGGYAAYGTFDGRFKYGGNVLYMFDKNPRRALSASFRYDLEQLGASQNAFREDFFLAFLFRRQPADKLSFVEEIKLSYEHEWFRGFSTSFILMNRNLYPVGGAKFQFYVQEGETQKVETEDAITSAEFGLDFRFAYKERVTIGEFERISLGAKFPIIDIKYAYGMPNFFKSDYEYHKLQIGIKHWFNILNFGWSRFNVEAGRIWGTLPYPLLKLHEGNETYFFDESAFNMMNYYEFVSDKYLKFYYTHHFNGLLFNRIPLFRKLKWREVGFVTGLIGGMDQKNRDFSVWPQGMYTLDKPYFEAGAGIENIFKIIRIDAIWRLSYLDHANVSPFGVRASLVFKF
ncbi:MAG: hypothetical protein C0598_09795 [Marinilabiliales bacterium]|nr:MAG: hypothetical protein C0598_09795 [Marinilabiliales bacterium]